MGYQDACEYLDSLGVDAMKRLRPSLHRMEAICEALDHPERSLDAIHITGTNGKTSTARIATSLLSAAGLHVGTYTSPHLQTVRERICRNGRPIDPAEFGEIFDHLFPYVQVVERQLDERLSYFEILTAMFFLWAAEAPVDAAVIEVGMGGAWDATNVLPKSVSAITNVSIDHAALLGAERTTIAAEKVGIIKRGADVVTGERSPDVLAIVRDRAEEMHGRVYVIDRDFAVEGDTVAVGGRYVTLRTGATVYPDLFLPLHGSHQAINAAVALDAVSRFIPAKELSHEVVAEGFAGIVAPGRLERIVHPEAVAPIVLDVAHNPDGMSAAVGALLEDFTFDRVVVVFGVLAEKDYEGMLMELARLPASLIVTQPRSARSAEIDVLRAAADKVGLEHEAVDDVAKAVETAMGRATEIDLICITGSHYVVGEARSHLVGEQD